MADYKTPGVYIKENNDFPSSVVAVESAMPAFIGYTEKAERNGKSLTNVPTKITSFAEYQDLFGVGYQHKFTIEEIPAGDKQPDALQLNGKKYSVTAVNTFRLYNSMRLFYANGGADCFIISVGGYTDKGVTATDLNNDLVWATLEKEYEPTLIVIPDAVDVYKTEADNAAFYNIYTRVLAHCNKMQSCFAILDVPLVPGNTLGDKGNIDNFREGIGNNFLNYGAAYYPWLNTAVVQANEVTLLNLAVTTTSPGDATLSALHALQALNLPEDGASDMLNKQIDNLKKQVVVDAKATADISENIDNIHHSLMAVSPTYVSLMHEIRAQLNRLPPAAAMAGIYAMVDSIRGVWKAPANVSVNMVSSPTANITNEQQADFNVDPIGGKSINIIRPFPGIGTLVWGARTLDGNSQDWRYINVRRTLIMIEQSIKLAMRTYVFEPNNSSTWITVQTMISNFLTNLWKQGGLAGSTPEQAFVVQIGFGSTMTANDILDGKMLVTVKIAISHPAEFIVLTFQQMQQQS